MAFFAISSTPHLETINLLGFLNFCIMERQRQDRFLIKDTFNKDCIQKHIVSK